MTKFQIAMVVVVGIVLILFVLEWAEGHDRKVMEAAGVYEECVWVTYGMTPTQYLLEKDYYPTCNPQTLETAEERLERARANIYGNR